MVKSVYKFLIIITVVCLSVFFTVSALSVFSQEVFDEKEIESSVKDFSEEIFDDKEVEISAKTFPLAVDLQKTVFNVGDRLSCNATITNKCGKDVFVVSNGNMPVVYFYENGTTVDYILQMLWDGRTLKANDTMSKVADFTISEPPGTYIFEIFYMLEVDGVKIEDKLETIIEVK